MADFSPASLQGLTKPQQFAAAAAYAGVPVTTLQNIWGAESSQGTDPKAAVPQAASSALGDFQITAPTLAGVQAQTGLTLDRSKFEDSLFTAAHLMKDNMRAFNGDLGTAVAAYNQGPEQARSAAGLAYAAKVMGGTVPTHPSGDLEIEKQGALNNNDALQMIYAPQLQGDTANIRPRDIMLGVRQAKTADEKDAPFVQRLQTVAGSEVIANQAATGDTSTPTDALQASRDQISDLPVGDQINLTQQAMSGPLPPNANVTTAVNIDAENNFQNAVDRQQVLSNTSATEAFLDGFKQNNIVARVLQNDSDQAARAAGYDGNWTYTKDQDDALREAGWTEAELDRARDTVGPDDLSRVIAEVADQREHDENNAQHGLAGFAGGMVGGLADPAAWLLTGGVAAGAQSLGLGVRAGLAARVALAGAEGVASNLTVTAALQAAGSNMTSHDYLMAGLTGAVLGSGLHGLMAGADAGLDAMRTGMAASKADLHAQAALDLGPGATPEQIAVRANELDQRNFEARTTAQNTINLAPVDDTQRILPGGLYDDTGATGDIVSQRPAVDAQGQPVLDANGTPVLVGDQIAEQYGIDMTTEERDQRLMQEQIARAQLDDIRNPIDTDKMTAFTDKLPPAIRDQIQTYGMTLAKSDNPIARYVSRNLMESAAGTAERVRTAAVTKTQLENIAREHWGDYNAAYDRYRQENSNFINGATEAVTQKIRQQFDSAVRDEVYARRGTPVAEDSQRAVPQRVKEGADALERAYGTQLSWAKSAQILGHEGLPNTARGYLPQRIALDKVMVAPVVDKRVIAAEIARQLQHSSNGIDAELAPRLANEYIQHARSKATGEVERPDNLYSSDVSANIEEALERLGIAGDKQAQALLDKYQRGGAGFTKARYEFDLSAPVQTSRGLQSLGDFFETDQARLYQQYTGRMSGEVALSQYGVYGVPGIAALRKAMVQASEGGNVDALAKRELPAYDAFMADMMGRPTAEMTSGMRAFQNLRQLASMNILGGMGFTQASELANLATTIGAGAMVKSIPIVRQMFKEARLMQSNGIFDTIELIGGRHDALDKWHFPSETRPGDTAIYGHDTPGLLTRGISTAARKFQVITGHRMIHAYQMRMSTEQIASKVLRAANGSTGLGKLVTEMGFNEDFMSRLKADLPNIATFDGKWVSGLDLSKTADPQTMSEFVQGVQRGAKQVIQGSFRGEGMKAQTHVLGQFLTQFRNFGFLAMEKQWARVAGTVGVPVATAMMVGQMMLSIPIYLARVRLNAMGMQSDKQEQYLKSNTSPIAIARASMNYSGLTGLLGDSLDLPMGVYNASTGKDARTGENQRTGAWGVSGIVPGLSYADGAIRSSYNMLHKPSFANAAKLGKSVLPGGNVPYFAFAMNAATNQ